MWISRSPGLPVSRDPHLPASLSPFGGRWSTLAQAILVVAFLVLLLSYRDYPAIVATGLARERAMVAGERAYAAGDYAAAERDLRAAIVAQPSFVDARVDLALALAAQGRRDEARALLRDAGGSRQADFLAGILARDSGDVAAAVDPLADAELTAGEDIQAWAVEWLRPPATDALALDGVRDLGYIVGFSGSERGPAGSYRWLEGDGRVVLPLAQPLRGGAAISLRMASGRPSAAPLDIWIADRWAGRVSVAPGGWRAYRLPIPAELAGGTRLDIRLSAPTFVPARADPASDDPRALSLMISQVRVQ